MSYTTIRITDNSGLVGAAFDEAIHNALVRILAYIIEQAKIYIINLRNRYIRGVLTSDVSALNLLLLPEQNTLSNSVSDNSTITDRIKFEHRFKEI